MGCNCKSSNDFEYKEKSVNQSIGKNIFKYFFKLTAFTVSLFFLPIIMLVIAWFLFDTIVLNKNVDLGRLVNVVANNIKKFNEEYDEDEEYDEEDDEDEEYDEEDYIALNVEDITDKIK